MSPICSRPPRRVKWATLCRHHRLTSYPASAFTASQAALSALHKRTRRTRVTNRGHLLGCAAWHAGSNPSRRSISSTLNLLQYTRCARRLVPLARDTTRHGRRAAKHGQRLAQAKDGALPHRVLLCRTAVTSGDYSADMSARLLVGGRAGCRFARGIEFCKLLTRTVLDDLDAARGEDYFNRLIHR